MLSTNKRWLVIDWQPPCLTEITLSTSPPLQFREFVVFYSDKTIIILKQNFHDNWYDILWALQREVSNFGSINPSQPNKAILVVETNNNWVHNVLSSNGLTQLVKVIFSILKFNSHMGFFFFSYLSLLFITPHFSLLFFLFYSLNILNIFSISCCNFFFN